MTYGRTRSRRRLLLSQSKRSRGGENGEGLIGFTEDKRGQTTAAHADITCSRRALALKGLSSCQPFQAYLQLVTVV